MLGDGGLRVQRGARVGDDRVACLEDKLLLAGEELVEVLGRDAGLRGELLHGRRAVALLAQKRDDGVVQAPPVMAGDLVGTERAATARQPARRAWAGGRHTRTRILGRPVAR